MNHHSLAVLPIALALGITTPAHGQVPEYVHAEQKNRAELLAYHEGVRTRIKTLLNPLGFKHEKMAGTHFRQHHVGYALGDSGLSAGIAFAREKSIIPHIDDQRYQILYSVNYTLSFK